MADITARNEYLAARKQARKYLSEHANDPNRGHPAVLESILDREEHAGEISLGVHEVPLRKIVGTYTDIRSGSFSGNWLPLLAEGTEFASKWQSLYAHHIRDGITDPIKVYEYLGYFYVLEGNKRVSVLSWVGAYSLRADVTRILPRYDETNEEMRIYYEIIGYDPRCFAFSGMWFRHYGSFTALIEGARRFASQHEELRGLEPHQWLPRAYNDFALQYDRAGFRSLDITTADAFIEYINVYDFPYNLPLDQLAEQVRACGAQFRLAAGEGGRIVVESNTPSPRSGVGLFGLGVRRAHLLFAYRTPPSTSSWTRSHEIARQNLKHAFDGRVTTSAVYDISDTDPYPALKKAVEFEKPDILFTVNSLFSAASLRIALEYPQTLVFNCNHAVTGLNLNTYFTKLYEQTFILGAAAGAYTATDVIGFVDLPARATDSTYAINAFAQGARLVNHNIRVKRCTPRINYSGPEDRLARRKLAEAGCDVVLCQYPNYDEIVVKPCDDLYAMLCSIDRRGSVVEYLAGAAWNWGAIYEKILNDYLSGSFEPILRGKLTSSFYFWLGTSSSAAPIYKVDAALGTHTARLCDLFTELIRHSRLHPFIGPIRDRDGVLRVSRYDMPNLSDIRRMNWLCDIVDETIALQ